MVSEKTQSNAMAKSFKSPLFLVIAILFSVVALASLIGLFSSGFNLILILPLAFSIVSTIFAWLLYATDFSNAKLKNLRLFLAYQKIMTTILTVLVCILTALALIICILLVSITDVVKDEIVPVLENDLKPALEDIIENAEDLENSDIDMDEIMAELPPEIKETLGGTLTDMNPVEFAQSAVGFIDGIIAFIEAGFIVLTIIVALVCALLITAFIFVGKAFKKASKYIRALAEGTDADKKPPFAILFIGGGIIALGGLLTITSDIFGALSTLATGAILILFAIFFKKLNEDRYAFAAEAAAAAEEAPATEETPAE